MFYKYLFLFLCIVLLVACSQDRAYRLPKKEMQQVLLDVQLAEVYSTMAAKDSTQTQGLKNNDSLAVFYKAVFAHHGITATQFTQSLDWYRGHPDELDSVYTVVLKKLDVVERGR